MRKTDLNAIYISERVQETLRPVSVSALTAVVAPMGYGKTTAVNWFLNQRRQTEAAVDGVRYKGPVIIDDGGAQDRKKPSTDHVDGLVLVDLVVYVPLSLLKTIPQKGLNMEIGDHIYQITKVHPEAGEIVLYLEMLTE